MRIRSCDHGELCVMTLPSGQQRCRTCHNAAQSRWRKKNPDRARAVGLRHYKNHREQLRRKAREYARRVRSEVMIAYGGTCVCCGETHDEFLELDHAEGGGNEHRRRLPGGSTRFFNWLKQKGFPKDAFRILCSNCNQSIGKRGYCPHESLSLLQKRSPRV